MSDQLPPTDEQEQRAPNPLLAVGVALLIIIAFVIAIFIAVSPALAP